MPAKEKLLDCVVSLSLPRRGWAQRDRKVREAIRVSRSWAVPRWPSPTSATAASTPSSRRRPVAVGHLRRGAHRGRRRRRLTALDGGPWFDMGRKSQSIGVLGAAPSHHQTLLELLR